MVHSAYDSFELLNNCPTKIDAVESYGSKLLVGCSDGALRIYAPESASSDRSLPSDYHSHSHELLLRKEPYELEKTVTGFSKKPLLSMEALASRELLLSLSESIAFHRLPNLETIAVITKAKGANVYSWDDRRGFLCFARQKRVCIFRHDGGRGFVEVKDFGVPDTVKSMAWCGENICLGIRKEYVILNATNGALSEVFPSGRLAPPLVVSLPSGELLLGKIRSLRAPDYSLIQTIGLQNVRHLIQSNNAVIVALGNSVYGLFPVPLGAQIVQLTASGNFEEALALCKMLPPEESSLRAAKEASIHIRYAHYLFENGSYEEAMDQFLASQVDITYVLSLYPSIILPKTSMIPEPEKLVDISSDAPYLSRGSSGVSDDMESSLPEFDEHAALESKKMSHNTLMALIKFLQKKRYSIIEKATAEGTEEVVLDAVGDNFGPYDSARFKKANKGRGNIAINSGAREMAAILDTALLQALLLTGQPSAALELLKGLNYCDLKICEEILQKTNHYAALLELYKCNSMHREALKLLHQLVEESKSNQSQSELPTKFKPESIIEYLKPLCGTDPMLVLEYSMLVLESCPTQTIELFLSGNIPADLVNSYLKQHAPSLQGRYLELMLAMNENGISGNLQNEMVQIYLSEVLEWHADLSAQQKWDEKEYSPTRKKLLSALETKGGRGIKKIAEIEGAQEMRISPSSTDSGRSDGDADDFIEEGGSTIMLDQVLDLLSRRWDRINGAQAIKLLPRETKLQNLLPFLGPLLKKSSEAYRNLSVIKSLRQSESLQVKDELYNQRKTVVKIGGDTMCSLCNKKIGTSVFAVYPNGKTIVHFVCFRDSQSMKAVGKGSSIRKR
ncbi:Vam6/Vps39-like protein [Turnera subulata]|uniref:Vam6/Vps39-like protein n=1 Tax=Turnera subulata TaxID=218843 RepID=A0A9Q0JQG6_9ROSI|nr:Vam6/Vps39-like protein [Turnera subulata]